MNGVYKGNKNKQGSNPWHYMFVQTAGWNCAAGKGPVWPVKSNSYYQKLVHFYNCPELSQTTLLPVSHGHRLWHFSSSRMFGLFFSGTGYICTWRGGTGICIHNVGICCSPMERGGEMWWGGWVMVLASLAPTGSGECRLWCAGFLCLFIPSSASNYRG